MQIQQSFSSWQLWVACLLVFINWGIEARKWQLLLKPLEPIYFLRAYRSVLAGCSITMLTPNRVGEYGGRILYVQEKNRLDAIPLTILGSVSQLFITIVLGILGLMYFACKANLVSIFHFLPKYTGLMLLAISMLSALFLGLVYFKVGPLINYLQRFKKVDKIVAHIILLNTFSDKQLLRILFLSLLRYSIFILQYILLLQAMQVHVGIGTCFWVLTIFYLVMAVAPTIGFIELPVRATVSLSLLQVYTSNVLGIEAASLGIWIINLVIPAILGSILILGIKILKEK